MDEQMIYLLKNMILNTNSYIYIKMPEFKPFYGKINKTKHGILA